jgi:hypothetical protein
MRDESEPPDGEPAGTLAKLLLVLAPFLLFLVVWGLLRWSLR